MVSLTNPVERLDWTLLRVVVFFHHWFPLLEKFENQTFILPRNFPAVFIIFAGRGVQRPSQSSSSHPRYGGCVVLAIFSNMSEIISLFLLPVTFRFGKGVTLLHYISLSLGGWNIDHQYRGPNINDRDRLIGLLSNKDHDNKQQNQDM